MHGNTRIRFRSLCSWSIWNPPADNGMSIIQVTILVQMVSSRSRFADMGGEGAFVLPLHIMIVEIIGLHERYMLRAFFEAVIHRCLVVHVISMWLLLQRDPYIPVPSVS